MCHLLIACLVYYLPIAIRPSFSFFFFNDTATTEIYPLSLHDALPILGSRPTLVPEARLEGRDLVRAAEHEDLVTGEELLLAVRVGDAQPGAADAGDLQAVDAAHSDLGQGTAVQPAARRQLDRLPSHPVECA